MRSILAISFALFAGSLAQAQSIRERTPLFPRLHSRLHPQQCVPAVPSCPPLIVELKPEPKVEAPAKTYDYVTISGFVLWPGDIAIPPVKLVNARPALFPGFGPVPINDVLIEPKTRGIKNVIVWIRPDNMDRSATFPLGKVNPELAAHLRVPDSHVIRIMDGNFEPRILAARAGDSLRFDNTAPVPININYSSDIEQFNVNLRPGAEKKVARPLEAQRTVISIACNIHPWMQAKARVFDHPYYALTDEHGHFEIRDVPVGKWRIVYQHEHGYHKGRDGLLGFPIEVKSDKYVFHIDPLQYQPAFPR